VKSRGVPVRQAAREHGVTRSALNRAVKSDLDKLPDLGRRPVLPEIVEIALKDYILDCAAAAKGVTLTEMSGIARALAGELDLVIGDWVAGLDWAKGFLRRFDELSIRTATKTTGARIRMWCRLTVNAWYAVVSHIAIQ
jgi:hypothetical protein